jgi:hypothetical protein
MLAILRFRASKPGAEGFRPRLAARSHGSPPHSWGIVHCPDEPGSENVWCTGELLSKTVRISVHAATPVTRMSLLDLLKEKLGQTLFKLN